MDQAENPYAPSRAILDAGEARPTSGISRDGNVLVIPRDNDLPALCVKCNEPADEPTKTRTIYWHHPAFYLALLVNLILFAILALIFRKTAKLSPGLCEGHKRRRVIGIAIGWGGFFVSLFAMIAFADAGGGAFLAVGVLVMLGSIIAGLLISRIIYAKRIDERYVRIKGCGEAFLSQFPEYRPSTRDL